MPSQTHRRKNRRRQQNRNRSAKSSLANSDDGLRLAGSMVGVSALSQGAELIQNNNEEQSHMLFGGKGRRGGGGGRETAEYILRFLEMLNTIKIYHWSTLSYPTHKATDELHSKMSELIDSFIEIYIGHLSRGGASASAGIPVFKRGDSGALSFCECKSLGVFCKKLDEYIVFMDGLTNRLNGYTDLVNIRDEMVGAVTQALYLLRLS
jgi:hypothetical protein